MDDLDVRRMTLTTENVVKHRDCYYFVALELNAVCKIDSDGTIDIIGKIPNESDYKYRVCSRILSIDGKLLFLPMNGKSIWIYDTDTDSWESIKIDDSESIDMKTMQGIVYDRNLYLVGCFYPAIIVVDLDSREINYIREPYTEYQEIHKKRNSNYFRCDYAIVNNHLYIASCLNNTVLIINLKTNIWKIVEVGDKDRVYSGIAWDGYYFWLSPKTGNILVRWNGKNEYEYFTVDEENCGNNFRFTGILCVNHRIYLPAKDGNVTYIFSKKDMSDVQKIRKSFLFFQYDNNDNSIISGTRDGKIHIEKEDGKHYEISCDVNISHMKRSLNINGRIFSEIFNSEGLITIENRNATLEEFLLYLSDEEE